ncbi:hypothetical protein GGR51DRAFT_112708 [Nemania sp. FL0031]|nr:hypothetical protein GGR51DRAFT_112708 [Nemania sp. FL0031]
MPKEQLALLYWLFLFAIIHAAIGALSIQQSTPTPRTTTPPIQGRDSVQILGFISGNPYHPLFCDGASTLSITSNNVFGCCDGDDCWLPATCVTSDSPICSTECPYAQITRCNDKASPSCAEYILQTAEDDTNSYTNYLCLPIASIIHVLASPTVAGDSDSFGVRSSGVPLVSGIPSNDNGGGDSSGNSGSDSGGLSKDQKIALGLGLSVPVVALIVSLLAWLWPRQRRRRYVCKLWC